MRQECKLIIVLPNLCCFFSLDSEKNCITENEIFYAATHPIWSPSGTLIDGHKNRVGQVVCNYHSYNKQTRLQIIKTTPYPLRTKLVFFFARSITTTGQKYKTTEFNENRPTLSSFFFSFFLTPASKISDLNRRRQLNRAWLCKPV